MPLAAAVVGSAVVGAGASIYSASQASKASSKATAAANAASQQQLAAQQANFDRIYNLNQPFVQGGQGAYAKLLQQFGITPANTGTGGAPAGAIPGRAFGGGVDTPPTNWNPGPSGRADDTFALTGAGDTSRTSVIGSMGFGGSDPSTAVGGPGVVSSGPEYPGAPYITPGSGGGFDAATYLQQNPDVAAEAANHPDMTPEQYAAQHAQQYGGPEGRNIPTLPVNPAQTTMPDYMNTARPDTPEGPTFGARQDVQMGDYGQAPDMGGYFSNFQADPGYQFRLSEGLNGVNAASAVRGKLRSGDTAKALAGYSSNLASQEYGNWFNRQMQQYQAARGAFENNRSFAGNLWNQQQDRADTNYNNDRAYGTARWQDARDTATTNFNTDRAYQTGRYDTNTGNLFNLTNVGLTGAGNIAGAGTNFANAASDVYGSQANAAANNAYNRAQANSYAANGIANAAGNLFAAWGGGGGGASGGIGQGGNVSVKNTRIF